MIPLKHLSANIIRNIKTGSTQTTRFYGIYWLKGTKLYKDACRILQKYTQARKSEWWEMKAEELQRAADRNDMKGFYSGLKEVWRPQTKQPVHLKSSDGLEIFTDSKSVIARWSEYFQKLLNVPGDIEPEVLENIQIQNPFLMAQSTQIKSVISVPIKDFINHYPRALFNDIPRVGAYFYDIPGSGRTFTTYPSLGAV